MATGQWRKALEKVGDTLVSEATRNLVKKLVIEMGVEETEASPEIIAKVVLDASKGIGVVSYFAKNIGLWWHFLENIRREPFAEEITFKAKRISPPTIPNLVVTKGLVITPSGPYYSGETVTASFTITNRGGEPVNIHVLTLGGVVGRMERPRNLRIS